jgi:hypothetical protein
MAMLFNDIPTDGTTVIWGLIQPNLDNPPNVISGVVIKKLWSSTVSYATIKTEETPGVFQYHKIDIQKCFPNKADARTALVSAKDSLVTELDAEIAALAD